MERIERISEIASSALLETKLALKDKGKKDFKREVDKFLNKIHSGSFNNLLSISNVDVFYIFSALLYDDEATYEEIKRDVAEVAVAVNKWSFKENGRDLDILEENTNYGGILNDNKYLENFQRLNLTQTFLEYPMKYIYKAMYSFLRLKRDLQEASQKSASQTPILLLNRPDLSQSIKTRTKTAKEIYETSNFKGFVMVIEEHLEKEMKKYEENKSILSKRKQCFEELLNEIKKPTFQNISSIPSVWHQYLDPKTLEELYYLVQENLLKEKKTLDIEEKDLNSIINKSSLTTYLYNHNINPKQFKESLLMSLETIPNIESRINILVSLDINIIDIINNHNELLHYLSDDKIKKIEFLINSHAISKSKLRENLYYILDEKYNELMTNYEILKPIIDFDNIFYNDQVMFVNPHILKNILSTLAEYKLTKNNFIFLLCNYNYLSIYDLLIEQEIPEYLFISICKTKSPINTIRRIMIYKLIGEDYETPNHLLKKDVIEEDKFACQDRELDNYLTNYVPNIVLEPVKGDKITASSTSNKTTKFLDDNYRIDDLYIIGKVNISRPKFLRNFESRNCNSLYIIASLISDSILDEASIYSIYSELEEKKLKR